MYMVSRVIFRSRRMRVRPLVTVWTALSTLM
jgi:hypothetical protein